ncbi:MAG TPA: TetR/AcrR family transcriptional regulator [Oligoflexus sp.]|uniref:TetR/AcrR family transcriptional regulator n=1 Tax=Oligoflexus sp. TaxID=1971216 RepID=UPI002D80F5CB|nr:TetR/AcrR family transcriptional regulator [Oligoflexus sp.]HET9236538.1 TetR/AcrR family transcriptional regulator [Oligoflexus sp.]
MDNRKSSLDPRKESVLKAAIGVFGRQGFKKTSVEDIADAAQLSKQGLYLHFAGKNEIFSAALFKYLDDGLKLVDEALLNESTLYTNPNFRFAWMRRQGVELRSRELSAPFINSTRVPATSARVSFSA